MSRNKWTSPAVSSCHENIWLLLKLGFQCCRPRYAQVGTDFPLRLKVKRAPQNASPLKSALDAGGDDADRELSSAELL